VGGGATVTRYFVTGASGFLGGAVARALLARGDAVRAFARSAMPELARLGAEVVSGDLADEAAVLRGAEGCSVALHVGAKAGVWGPRDEYRRSNVDGTRHVLDACRRHGLRALVYTSTPSVVHGGSDLRGANESIPHAVRFATAYPETKAEAERMVLAADGPDLATCALRPHLIWGPGDNQLGPRLVDRARRGRLVFPGDGRAEVDSTFIDAAVEAHLLAADQLRPGAACAGRAYFVSQGEPRPIMDLVNDILEAYGAPRVTRTVPAWTAIAAGAACEALYRVLGIAREPPVTEFVARQMSTTHWFDLTAIRRDLGYGPETTLEDGLRALRASARASR
jgi:nucleoside-diphosphate-sugar epimerase